MNGWKIKAVGEGRGTTKSYVHFLIRDINFKISCRPNSLNIWNINTILISNPDSILSISLEEADVSSINLFTWFRLSFPNYTRSVVNCETSRLSIQH